MSALGKLLSTVSKVAVKLGFIEVTFEPGKLKQLCENQGLIESLLSTLFMQRRVMWMDFSSELPEWVIKSLEEMNILLRQTIASLPEPLSEGDSNLSGLLHRWSDACVRARQAVQDKYAEMKENNRTAFHRDEFIDPTDYLPDILVSFRKETLPFVSALIQLLPDSSSYKEEVLKKWYDARRVLDEADKDFVVARWEEAES